MAVRFFLAGETKRLLQLYGFAIFTASTALTALAPLLAPSFLYLAGGAAVAGGAAGLIGYFASERHTHEPTLVFVSTAGQCRDPMAKVIMDQLLKDRPIPVATFATALRDNPGRRASKAARHVVSEEMGEDLLRNHRSRVLDDALITRADLILTMDEAHAQEIRKNFPAAAARIYSICGFLGERGNIDDPWQAPDEMTSEAIDRYRTCFRRLHSTLSRGADAIYAAVVA